MSAEAAKKKANPWPLRIVLFAILGVMIGLLIGDQIARAKCKAAWDKIEGMLAKDEDEEIKPSKTNLDVRAALGFEPEKGLEAFPGKKQETYRFPSILPGRSYTVTCVYTNATPAILHAVVHNDEPGPELMPGSGPPKQK